VDLSRFSPQQCAAITAGEGPLSILAGPGSGKTTTMAGRAAYLIAEREVPAASMLAITFTTAAAATLRGRLATVLGPTATYVDIRTFHSFGLKVIRSWSAELGFGHMPPVVYGRDETRAILRQAAQELGLELAPDQPIGEPDPWALSAAKLARSLDRFRLSGLETASSWQDADGLDDAVLSQLAEAYETLLRKQAAVDYAAMLVMPLRLFESEPRALRMLQDAYRHVLVDESRTRVACSTRFFSHSRRAIATSRSSATLYRASMAFAAPIRPYCRHSRVTTLTRGCSFWTKIIARRQRS